MSRRPRAPVSLRLLGARPEPEPALEIEPGETARLADPTPDSEGVSLPPALESEQHALVPDIPPTPALELAPPVDVVPASLVGATFALRRTELRFAPPMTERVPLVCSRISIASPCSTRL